LHPSKHLLPFVYFSSHLAQATVSIRHSCQLLRRDKTPNWRKARALPMIKAPAAYPWAGKQRATRPKRSILLAALRSGDDRVDLSGDASRIYSIRVYNKQVKCQNTAARGINLFVRLADCRYAAYPTRLDFPRHVHNEKESLLTSKAGSNGCVSNRSL